MPRKGDSFFDHRKRMRYRRIKKKKKKSHKDRVSYEPGDKHVLLPGPLQFVMQCFRSPMPLMIKCPVIKLLSFSLSLSRF